jgi:hypothetical protein
MPALEVRRRDGASKSSTEAMGRRGDGGRTGRNGGLLESGWWHAMYERGIGRERVT